jgi:C_GCAxxG_C_C family probable redox protein
MSNTDLALTCHKEGFNCSQAVLSAYAPQFGLEREMALRVAGAFGGGMGRMGETCGAVTGALMVIGLRYGQAIAEDKQAKEKSYAMAREFADRFKARHGCLDCRDLLGCDIGTPEGMQQAREQQLFATRCSGFIQDAVEIVEQLL